MFAFIQVMGLPIRPPSMFKGGGQMSWAFPTGLPLCSRGKARCHGAVHACCTSSEAGRAGSRACLCKLGKVRSCRLKEWVPLGETVGMPWLALASGGEEGYRIGWRERKVEFRTLALRHTKVTAALITPFRFFKKIQNVGKERRKEFSFLDVACCRTLGQVLKA